MATNGWDQSKLLVEHRLVALEDSIEEIKKRVNEHEVQISLLNFKAGLWGVVMASATTVIINVVLVWFGK